MGTHRPRRFLSPLRLAALAALLIAAVAGPASAAGTFRLPSASISTRWIPPK